MPWSLRWRDGDRRAARTGRRAGRSTFAAGRGSSGAAARRARVRRRLLLPAVRHPLLDPAVDAVPRGARASRCTSSSAATCRRGAARDTCRQLRPRAAGAGPRRPRRRALARGDDDRATASALRPDQGLERRGGAERIDAYRADPEAIEADAAAVRAAAARRPVRPPLPGRGARALALVAGILVLGGAAARLGRGLARDQARAEAVFSREAAKIAGHPAQVRCDTKGDYVGFLKDADGLAFVGGNRAYLTPSICDTLYQLAFKHRTQSFPGRRARSPCSPTSRGTCRA